VPRQWLLGLGLLVLLGFFRWQVVKSWHVPAGDGIEYYQLSQELSAHHRYAHGPLAPPTYVRLPGYPLFLSYVAVRTAPLPKEEHLVRATHWNVLLNVATALLICVLLLELRTSAAVAWGGAVLVLVCPIILYLCCYGLTESLATFLVTAELVAAIRGMRRRLLPHAVVAGVFVGLAQLVRVSSVMTLPSVVGALLLADAPWRRRLAAVAVCGACALVVFAPWPLRNHARFGSFHPLGAEWESVGGEPLPPGPPQWMRSWATGAPGESYVSLMLVYGRPLDDRLLSPQMYDDEDEKKRVLGVFARYNRERLTPSVDAEFAKLAHDRLRRHPIRALVILPFKRLVSLWKPMPEWELPMRTPLLGLPALRPVYGFAAWILYALGFIGAAILWRRQRQLALLLVGGLVLSSLMHAYLHAFPVERYLAPTLPPLLALAAIAGAEMARWPTRRRRASEPTHHQG
jgi:hypothetical protein